MLNNKEGHSLLNSDGIISVNDLTLSFNSSPDHEVIKNINFHINKGETVAIIGESGSGKSVTASAIMGLFDKSIVNIRSGGVFYQDRNILNFSNKELSDLYGKKISIVFQDPLLAFNPVLSVGYQISESMTIHGVPKRIARTRTLNLLSRVGILNPQLRYKDYPHQFSGGQRQRLLIAMAISMTPDLLIADEPTSALDSNIKTQIISLLKDIQMENQMGMLFITHDIVLAKGFADRIIVMKNGQIVESGYSQDIFLHPKHEYTKMLISCIPGSGKPNQDVNPRKSLLDVVGLNQSYPLSKGLFFGTPGVKNVLDDVSFTVYENEVLCVVGESGSGKSTLVKSLLGLQKYNSGLIKLSGRPINPSCKDDIRYLRSGIQAIFQDPASSLNPLMNIQELISEGLSDLNGDEDTVEQRVHDLLISVGLPPDCNQRFPHEFSGGQLQRVAIARALGSQPKLLIADEAVSALDVSIQFKIINLLRELKRKTNFSILFITHDLALVKDFADRVIVLSDGRVVENGTAEQIFTQPRSDVTRELLVSANLYTV